MLKHLKIENLAVIDRAELDLDAGFICLTGESGTGKSVLIDALLLLCGERASSDLVRTGCEKAVVEAVFERDTSDLPETDLVLLEEGEELFLRREVRQDGKSRAFVNGVMVPNNLLQKYGELAFEIHGQHGQQRLLKPANHLAIFDDQNGLGDQASRFDEALEDFRQDYREYRERVEGEANRLKELDFLQVQIGEIEEAGISEDDADLEVRLKRARNQEKIRANRYDLNKLLEDQLVPDLQSAERLLLELAEFEPSLEPYSEQLTSLSAVLGELRHETSVWTEGEDDQDILPQLEARESTLNKLFMKYGRDVPEVLAELDRLKARRETLLRDSEGLESRWAALENHYARLKAIREGLHRTRAKATTSFTKTVKAGLRELAMPKAEFVVENQWPTWPAQLDRHQSGLPSLPGAKLQFLFSSNLGEPVKALTKVASGGELSRVLLALINAFQRPAKTLLVFDEIDAGLGGEIAHTVGAKLAQLGKHHQVMCVTHFAQVARFADQQIKLEKQTAKGRTFTSLAVCDYEQRVAELARLMAGNAASQNLQQHARELLAAEK